MKATKVWSREDVNDGISTYKKINPWNQSGMGRGWRNRGPYLASTGLFKNSNNMDISNTALCKNSAENPRW